MFIKNHRNDSVRQGQLNPHLAQMAVSLIIGVHRNPGIAQHRFRSGGRDNDRAGTIGIGIANMIQFALGILMLHLVIRQCSPAARAPVDDIITFIDETFLIESNKDLPNRLGKPLIHSESLTFPVAGGTKFLQLVDDRAALFRAPLPYLVDKGITAEIVSGFSLPGQLPFNDVLGGNAGMIGSRYPQGVVTAHAVITSQDILQSIVQGMTDMQHTGDVGRGNNY